MPEILKLEGVCRDFTSGVFRTHTVRAVDHVTFSLERGRTFGLVGNSGCGKTTLSRMITRVLRPSAGRILFEGEDISAMTGAQGKTYHRQVQMVFQNPEASLDPTMRVRDSLLEALAIHQIGSGKEERMEKVLSTLTQVGLPEYLLSRYPHQISGGDGQRLVICRALLLEPEVLLLDEPTSMLDVSVQASVMNLLKELQQRLGLTYLYITHDIELLGWISHTIGVMQKGRLVEMGPREQVMNAPAHPYTRELLYSYQHWD